MGYRSTMRLPPRSGPLILAFGLFLGCSEGTEVTPVPEDGGTDANADASPLPDAAVDDAGAPPDAGTALDAKVEPPPGCIPGESNSNNRALSFDGIDDHVTMGVAPELGLTELTVEAWVRREGPGAEAGTGVGGLELVPIAGKGRGENDQGNLNCNYAFGFVGGVLGADFEDDATGANHPITGSAGVPFGEWHHVAATYDGATWRLFVDGHLDASMTVDATPRADSIQHFGIGTAFNSSGDAVGRFEGAIDEVRVWDHARTGAELRDAMYQTLETAGGLVGRWGLDTTGTVSDTAGVNDGMVVGATIAASGPVLDLGLPPVLRDPAPGDGNTLRGEQVELSIAATDPEDDPVTVRFHARPVSPMDDFSIVVLPDTQYYSARAGLDAYFNDQTAWIVENREAYNIVAVIHNGDIVDRGLDDGQWAIADQAMSALEAPIESSDDGIPYGVCVGNHDLNAFVPGATSHFNDWFGVDRFIGRAYYGGHYADSNDESWVTFSAGGLDFVVVNLSYNPSPSAAVLDWARSIFLAHPNAFGILNAHYIIGRTANFGAQGQDIYDALRDVDNVQLMTCGHISAESRRTDVFQGNVIHSMLADYQSTEFDGVDNGGSGFLRIWEFSPANGEVTVRSYSPTLDRFLTDADSEFTLEVDLPGAGAPFSEIDTVTAEQGVAAARLEGLEPGSVYEWYAVATDCAHTVRSPVYRFTTTP